MLLLQKRKDNSKIQNDFVHDEIDIEYLNPREFQDRILEVLLLFLRNYNKIGSEDRRSKIFVQNLWHSNYQEVQQHLKKDHEHRPDISSIWKVCLFDTSLKSPKKGRFFFDQAN